MSAVSLHGETSGRGPLVVLLHPVGLDHRFWGTLPSVLAAERRVLALDLAGHGRSPSVARPRSLEDYADDVAGAIVLAGGPAAVVGLSFGGMIAQVVALRHPDLVSMLVPGACGGTFAEELRPVLRERGLVAEREGMVAVVETTLQRWFSAGYEGAAVRTVRERLLSQDAAGWSAGWHAIAGLDATRDLGALRIPTLVVAGEADAATPSAVTEATVARVIPGARFAVIPDAPHMMQIETADAYASTVAGFLLGAAAHA